MENAIEIKNLVKNYKDKCAVNSINLNIKHGDLYALLGVNGAGKTTVIKVLTGVIKPTSGDALLNGKSILKDIASVKKIINVSPQETAIAPNLTVRENLEFIAGVYEITNSKIKINELISEFHLEKVLKQKAKTLSGGWQRRLSIAMSLINDPEILFLDEPTLGLDVLARRELWEVIKSLKGKTTIVLTTHYMEEAEMLSDMISIMVAGNIVATGTAKSLIKEAHTKTFEDAFVKLATRGNN